MILYKFWSLGIKSSCSLMECLSETNMEGSGSGLLKNEQPRGRQPRCPTGRQLLLLLLLYRVNWCQRLGQNLDLQASTPVSFQSVFNIIPRLCACVLSRFSSVWLFATPWTIAQAPLSMGFSRQEHRSGLPCLQEIFLIQGSNPHLLCLLHCRQILYHWATGEAHIPLLCRRNAVKVEFCVTAGRGQPWGSKDKSFIPSSVNNLLGCCCSVAQSCLTLCDSMDCSMRGFPVLHYLPEFAQTYVHGAGDAIQPPHPLLSPTPPAFNLSQHQGLFQWVGCLHQVAKGLELQLQHQSFQWIFRTDFL